MAEQKNRGPHQAKNRPQVPSMGSSDAIFGGSVSVANPEASADERKTVILDSDLEGLEFEDKVWLYWKRNKSFIYLCVAVLFASIIISNGWRMYSKYRAETLAKNYAAADTFEKRAEFAKANAGTSAAGSALILNADKLFSEAKYAEAASLYAASAKDLKNTVLSGRAQVGEAISLLKAGDQKGKSLLEGVAANQSLQPYSSEAAYHLGVLAYSLGKSGEAKKYFEQIVSAKDSGPWASLADNYLQRLMN
ncbi:MAG: hypothetical protein J6P03_01740 [Opitutales bacterium]|nr:hypothetical protein [Opitutales bacterium]